jgi:photosystem II stability/assembly factor-like uncharacterized protein
MRNVALIALRVSNPIIFLFLCLALLGCANSGWESVTPHYEAEHPPERYSYTEMYPQLSACWESRDGSQLWAVGQNGTILHYSVQLAKWVSQNSGTRNWLLSIFGNNDGSQLWAVGENGTILHYTTERNQWQSEPSGTLNRLFSVFGNDDGTKLWAVGQNGTILHKSTQLDQWRQQQSGTQNWLKSISGNSDGSQLWAVGTGGIILHFPSQAGRWEPQTSNTSNTLNSVQGSVDGSQVWAVGDAGTIVHYSTQVGQWEVEPSNSQYSLYSIFGNTTASELWAVGDGGTILHYSSGQSRETRQACQPGLWQVDVAGTQNRLYSVSGRSDASQLLAVGENRVVLQYSSQHKWELQSGNKADLLISVFGSNDGSELWTVGEGGTVLHYSKQMDQWDRQTSGTRNTLSGVFATDDASQVWAVGDRGTILHYTQRSGRWSPEPSPSKNWLYAISGTSDGSQLWAVGVGGTVLHYSTRDGHWEQQSAPTDNWLNSCFATRDGSRVWAVGEAGTILHYSRETDRWEKELSGTDNFLASVFGSSDGSELWTVGQRGIILHHSSQSTRWEMTHRSGQDPWLSAISGNSDGSQLWASGDQGALLYYSRRTNRWLPQPTDSAALSSALFFRSVFATSDGSQMWAVGARGAILQGKRDGSLPYVREVRLVPTAEAAQLQVRVAGEENVTTERFQLSLYGSNVDGGEIPQPVSSIPVRRADQWVFDLNPEKQINVRRGETGLFKIVLKDGPYESDYEANLTYDPYHLFREHWVTSLALGLLSAIIDILLVLLFTRPLLILDIYRKVRIYELVESFDIPGIGKLVKILFRFTILPWFATHPRTLRAWISANRVVAARSWEATWKVSTTPSSNPPDIDVPYAALPLRIEDVSSRLLTSPSASDLESLFQGRRNVVQIIGPGGAGKTTLAKHIGDLALAGGRAGAFKECRLPIWIDEDITDLRDIIRRKIKTWYDSGEGIEDRLLDALLENGLLLIMIDRLSERSGTTREYVRTLYGTVHCNALVLTARERIDLEVPDQQFIFPQPLNSSTLLDFMISLIKYYFGAGTEGSNVNEAVQSQSSVSSELGQVGGQEAESAKPIFGTSAPDLLASSNIEAVRPFASMQSQLELGKRLCELIAVKTKSETPVQEIPVLPLPVVLFVAEAVGLARRGRDLVELSKSLPDVYSNYLRRINPKNPGTKDFMKDDDILLAAKLLAKLALKDDYFSKEFTKDKGDDALEKVVLKLEPRADPLRRLEANGVLLSRRLGATTFLRFSLDPVAEFLAAEAYIDDFGGESDDLLKLSQEAISAQGFYEAVLLVLQARQAVPGFGQSQQRNDA